MAAGADFHPLRIGSAEHAAGEALVLTFDVPAALASTFAFKPGQHVALRATIDGEDIRRNYSICGALGEPIRVAIKRVTDGLKNKRHRDNQLSVVNRGNAVSRCRCKECRVQNCPCVDASVDQVNRHASMVDVTTR